MHAGVKTVGVSDGEEIEEFGLSFNGDKAAVDLKHRAAGSYYIGAHYYT